VGLLSVLLKNTKTIYSTDQIDFEGVDIVDIEKFNQSVDLIIVFGGDGTLLGQQENLSKMRFQSWE
jgi:NAD kinase